MSNTREDGAQHTVDLARGYFYGFLASTFTDPSGRHFERALDPRLQSVAAAAANLLRSEAPTTMKLGPGERSPCQLDVRPVLQELERSNQSLVDEHRRVFGLLIGKAAPPNETEYCRSTDAFYRAQELADVNGFYRAFGLERDAQERERADHISNQLAFMAHLIRKEIFAAKSSDPVLREKSALCEEAQHKFFSAHLAWWVPAFAELLQRQAGSGLYFALAETLAAFIPAERSRLDVAADLCLVCYRPASECTDQVEGCCGPLT